MNDTFFGTHSFYFWLTLKCHKHCTIFKLIVQYSNAIYSILHYPIYHKVEKKIAYITTFRPRACYLDKAIYAGI